VIAAIHVGFLLFERISTWRILLSALALALHYRLHLDLPKLHLVPSVVNGAVVILNHFMWFGYFFRNDHGLFAVISFYSFMVWAVPISIVISYSTSELLPGFCKNPKHLLFFIFSHNLDEDSSNRHHRRH
jgi:hypothetical protein